MPMRPENPIWIGRFRSAADRTCGDHHGSCCTIDDWTVCLDAGDRMQAWRQNIYAKVLLPCFSCRVEDGSARQALLYASRRGRQYVELRKLQVLTNNVISKNMLVGMVLTAPD